MLFRVFHAFFGTACLYYHISSSFVNSFSTSFCHFFIFLFLFSRSFLYSSLSFPLTLSLRLTSSTLSAIISLHPSSLFARWTSYLSLRAQTPPLIPQAFSLRRRVKDESQRTTSFPSRFFRRQCKRRYCLEKFTNHLYRHRRAVRCRGHSSGRAVLVGMGGALRHRRLSLFRAYAVVQAKAGRKRQAREAQRFVRTEFLWIRFAWTKGRGNGRQEKGQVKKVAFLTKVLRQKRIYLLTICRKDIII